jgi:two-component system OmpR family sensor kinase
VTRLPIRLRLTLVFALVMAVVLAAVGAFLYVRLEAALDERIDESLRSRGDALAALVLAGMDGVDALPPLVAGEEGFAQVVSPGGDVVVASPGLDDEPLLSAAELAAVGSQVVLERELPRPAGANEARLLVERVELADGVVLVLVGESLEDRDEALGELLAQLLVALPVVLVLSSALGYVVAGAALRPVEAMRQRAAGISPDAPERRLPLPEARDEIRRLGETLNEMLERLDEGLRRERRFVADASHELRTPLATLKTEIELALRRPRSLDELQAALVSAGEDVDRLEQLAEDLLVLAASDEGRLALDRAGQPARELLESVASRFAARARAAGRAVEVVAPGRRTVVCNRRRLEQALDNLVDNALRHGAGTVRLEAMIEEDTVALRVSDEGSGFPAEFLSHAFERFGRADAARSDRGAGLGLAIVSAVTRAHGGTATATYRAEGGAEIILRLPRDHSETVGSHRALI